MESPAPAEGLEAAELEGGPHDGRRLELHPGAQEVSLPGRPARASYRRTDRRTAGGLVVFEVFPRPRPRRRHA